MVITGIIDYLIAGGINLYREILSVALINTGKMGVHRCIQTVLSV